MSEESRTFGLGTFQYFKLLARNFAEHCVFVTHEIPNRGTTCLS
jgi:hypothetical protein